MIVYFIVFISLTMVFWVGYPLLNAASGAVRVDELTQERTRSLLDSLEALYQSREQAAAQREALAVKEGDAPTDASPETAAGQTGSAPGEDDDFANIESRLLLELAKIYREQGIDPAASQDRKNSCPSCHGAMKPNFQFCPNCGAAAA